MSEAKNDSLQRLVRRLDDGEMALDACDEAIATLKAQDAEIRRLRDSLGVIARNVDAGAVHISWCSDYAKRTLANSVLCVTQQTGADGSGR